MAYMCDVTQLLLDGKLFLKQQQLLLKIHTFHTQNPMPVCVCEHCNSLHKLSLKCS